MSEATRAHRPLAPRWCPEAQRGTAPSIPWTRLRHDPPTVPGHYYYQAERGWPAEVVEVTAHEGVLHIVAVSPDVPFAVSECSPLAYWSGRIPDPTPPPFLEAMAS